MTVDMSSIKSFCDDRIILSSGMRYFQEGRVYKLVYMPETAMLKCTVRGAVASHSVEIILGDDDIVSCKCDCGRKSGENGVCKHIVAALFEYEKQQSDNLEQQGREFYEKVSHRVIRDITTIRLSRNKQVIRLIPSMEITKNNFGIYSIKLGLEVGTDKLYKVRKLDKLLEAIEENSTLEFSKNFIFNARVQTFGEAEMKLIEYLMTIRQIMAESGKSMSDRHFSLSGAVLINIFKLAAKCEQRDIILDKQNVSVYPVCIDEFKVPLELSKEDNKYAIDFEKWKEVVPIVSDYRVVLYENAFHVLSPEQAKLTHTLIDAGESVGGAKITFKMQDKNTVIENLVPKLRYLTDLSIDRNIRKDILIAELKVKVFLESTTEKNIRAKVLFCYENIEFNHFAGELPSCEEKVLLRDKRRENEFIMAAAKMGFVPDNGYIYIKTPGKIYSFLEQGMQKLSSMAEIYYSENFYSLKVVIPSRAVGAINIGAGNLFEFSVDFEDIPVGELENVLEAVREKQHYYRMTNGNFVNLKSKVLRRVSELMDNIDSKFENGKVQVTAPQAMYLDSQSKSEEITVKHSKSYAQVLKNLEEPIKTDFPVPKCLTKVMREYQVAGYRWLKTMASYGFGGILADEMGLGKTLQTIAFIISEYENKGKPALVVVPTSLLFNWQAEFKKFAPDYKVKIIYGQAQERKNQLKDIEGYAAVITSYGLIRRDVELYKKKQWSYCFIDEAQHIKNPNTVNAKAVKQINAEGFFAITGTPIENNLTELWSIFDFIMPGYLFSRTRYRRVYEIPIIKKNDGESIQSLLEHIKPFILRRLKSGVMQELPDKIETYMVTDLEEEQKQLYSAYAYRAKEEILRLTREKGFEKSRIEILARITRLRQLCCHPGLFVENYEGGSGKLNTLLEIVENGIASGRRMLIFSQFTSMLSIISEMLRQMGISYFYLDGSVKSGKRVEMATAFNEGQRDVFLISLKAGGTGLNLIGADTVIHYDPWWNPAVENQATDRVHRIGQTKVVQVIKLVAKGTIEEKIQDLKEKKQELINSVLQEGMGNISAMTLEEIQNLFD